METKFAKLFEHEEYGQILVLRDTNDEDEPCVKFMAQPPGMGLCSVSMSFSTDDRADTAFANVSRDQAVAGVADMWKFAL